MCAAREHGRRDGRPRTERTTAGPLAAAASSQAAAAAAAARRRWRYANQLASVTRGWTRVGVTGAAYCRRCVKYCQRTLGGALSFSSVCAAATALVPPKISPGPNRPASSGVRRGARGCSGGYLAAARARAPGPVGRPPPSPRSWQPASKLSRGPSPRSVTPERCFGTARVWPARRCSPIHSLHRIRCFLHLCLFRRTQP